MHQNISKLIIIINLNSLKSAYARTLTNPILIRDACFWRRWYSRPRVMPHTINVSLVALAALAVTVLADPSVDRRASMGFMGMRGKKDGGGGEDGGRVGGGNDETSAPVELDKRTLVFRRPLFDGGRTISVGGPGGSAEGFKRAMGFVGMRGKKEYYKGSASAAGFFGMRGKKVPSADSFFGVRGKKWPGLIQTAAPQQQDPEAEDAAFEHAMLVLQRIIDILRTDRGERVLYSIV